MSRYVSETDQPRPAPTVDIRRSHGGWLVCGMVFVYLLLIGLGTLGLRSANVQVGGAQLNLDRAVFLATSAATLTGFQQSIGANDFNPDNARGPAILLGLTIAGSLFTMIASALAAVRVLRLPFSDRKVILAAFIVELLALVLGTLIIYGHGAEAFDSAQQAASAFGNSGAVITGPKHKFPEFNSALAQLVLLPLAVLGGLGLPVLMELWYRLTGGVHKLSKHCHTVIALTAGVYVAATLVLFIPAWMHAQTLAADPVFMKSHQNFDGSGPAAFAAASTTAINTRTAGLPFDTLNYFSAPVQWLLVVLMMIGGNSAGTAGGLKGTTLFLVFTGFSNDLRGRPMPRAFGVAGAWIGAYLMVAGVSFVSLCAMEPALSAADAMFLIISALSNVGLSHGPVMLVGTPAAPRAGMFLLTFVMLTGRLVPLAVLWWMARSPRDAEVLVG